MVEKIKLGDKVRCRYTGFEGFAVAKTEFINGCIQYIVTSPEIKDGLPIELGIDEKSLILIEKAKKEKEKKAKKKKERTGGAMTFPKVRRNY